VLQMALGIPAATVTPRLAALPAALRITQDEALALVQDDPLFLLYTPDILAAAWEELKRAASKRPEWREQMGGWTAVTLRRYVHVVVVALMM
jgi:hypothetical protein